MRKFLVPILSLVGIIIVLAAFYVSRANPSVTETKVVAKSNALKGVSFSPKNFESENFNDFFFRASDIHDVISWAGPAKDLTDPTSAAFSVYALSVQYAYLPVFITDYKDPQSVLSFVKAYNPPFIAIGHEVNTLPSEELEQAVTSFNQLYDDIKEISPNTNVFVTFQYERLKGLESEWIEGGEPQWEILNKFEKADAFGITTYPGLVFHDPDNLPNNYYSEISEHTQKPLLFTEVGWPSHTEKPGWESTENEQGKFVHKLAELTQDLNLKVVIWSLFYDQDVPAPFSSIGLINRNSTDKEAMQAWREF